MKINVNLKGVHLLNKSVIDRTKKIEKLNIKIRFFENNISIIDSKLNIIKQNA